MPVRPSIAILGGALLTSAIAIGGARNSDRELAQSLSEEAQKAIRETGAQSVSARFANRLNWPTRHPLLAGGEQLDEGLRDKVAKAVAAIPGVGGVTWSDGSMLAAGGALPVSPTHCQDDVEALLRARSIRFEESSSRVDQASEPLLDEVAMALRPCLGSIIAITGHTDRSGPEAGNINLSKERAFSVQQALLRRGIPADGMHASGVGSSEPIEGLAPQDPANRRIEFSVVATIPLHPTPVDTPGPR